MFIVSILTVEKVLDNIYGVSAYMTYTMRIVRYHLWVGPWRLYVVSRDIGLIPLVYRVIEITVGKVLQII